MKQNLCDKAQEVSTNLTLTLGVQEPDELYYISISCCTVRGADFQHLLLRFIVDEAEMCEIQYLVFSAPVLAARPQLAI